MKIYLIEKTSDKRLVNLGGKITLDKLNTLLNKGNTVLLRNISGNTQTDLRLRKVPEEMKTDKGYKMIKAYYVINIEIGKKGFEDFSPKEVSFEQNLRFASLDRAINQLEIKQGLKRADWVMEKS